MKNVGLDVKAVSRAQAWAPHEEQVKTVPSWPQ